MSDVNTTELTESPPLTTAKRIERRGRPKGSTSRIGRAYAKPKINTRLPIPPSQFFNQNQAGKFFQYWQSVPAELYDLIAVHIYRKYPVVSAKQVDPTANDVMDVIAGKCPFDGDDWESWLLRMYGSGDYRIWLNDGGTNVTKLPKVSVRDPVFPPRLTYAELVMDDKVNASYIAGLRRDGIKLPGDSDIGQPLKPKEPTQEELEEMSSTTAFAELATSIIKDKIAEGSKSPIQLPDSSGLNMKECFDLSNYSAKSAIDLMAKQMETITSAGVQQQNPIEFMSKALEIFKTFQPKEKDNTELVAIMREFRQEITSINSRIVELAIARQQPTPEDEDAESKDPLERLQRMKTQYDLMSDMFGNGSRRRHHSDDDDEKPKSNGITEMLITNAFKFMPQILPALGTFAQALMIVSNNLAVAKTGVGQAINPLDAANQSQQPQPHPQPVDSVNRETGIVANGPSPETIAWFNELEPQEQQIIRGAQPFLAKYHETILNHLLNSDEFDGTTFADFIISSSANGRVDYDTLIGLGPDLLAKVLRSYEPIWQVIKLIPAKALEFVSEFCERDRIRAEELTEDGLNSEEEADEDEEGPTRPTPIRAS